MASVATKEEWEVLNDFLKSELYEKRSSSISIWLAIDDQENEGEWRDSHKNQPLNYTLPWAPGQPGGGNASNFARIMHQGLWKSGNDSLDMDIACLCERHPPPYLKLRGVCSDSKIDTNFQPLNNLTDVTKMKLVSLHPSVWYDERLDLWTLTDKERNITAHTIASHASYTLGKNNWTISGDKGCSRGGEEYTKDLKMSGCKG